MGFIGKVADDALGKVFVHDITAAGVTVGAVIAGRSAAGNDAEGLPPGGVSCS